MSFTSDCERVYQGERTRWRQQLARRRVLWLADQIYLSVHHKRPKSHIDRLLKRLRDAAGAQEGA